MVAMEIFQALFDYHNALYRQVWDKVMDLSEEQFLRDVPYSHGSLRNQLAHVIAVDARWLRGLQGVPGARDYHLNLEDFPAREGLRSEWESVAGQVRDYIASLDEDELAGTPTGMGGPVWQVLAHLINHGTDHRAQILRALHDLGVETFDQDLILHLWMR